MFPRAAKQGTDRMLLGRRAAARCLQQRLGVLVFVAGTRWCGATARPASCGWTSLKRRCRTRRWAALHSFVFSFCCAVPQAHLRLALAVFARAELQQSDRRLWRSSPQVPERHILHACRAPSLLRRSRLPGLVRLPQVARTLDPKYVKVRSIKVSSAGPGLLPFRRPCRGTHSTPASRSAQHAAVWTQHRGSAGPCNAHLRPACHALQAWYREGRAAEGLQRWEDAATAYYQAAQLEASGAAFSTEGRCAGASPAASICLSLAARFVAPACTACTPLHAAHALANPLPPAHDICFLSGSARLPVCSPATRSLFA